MPAQARNLGAIRKPLYAALVAVAVTANMLACLPNSPAPQDPAIVYTAEDLSAFEQFTFYRAGGEGFCPPEDAVLRAELRRQPDGGITLDMWILEPGTDPETAGASGPGAEVADLIGQRLPPRALTAVEIDRAHEVFESVMIGNLVWSSSEHKVTSECQLFDPCLLNFAVWDGRQLGVDTPCHPADQVLSREQMNVIIDLLESFRVVSD